MIDEDGSGEKVYMLMVDKEGSAEKIYVHNKFDKEIIFYDVAIVVK